MQDTSRFHESDKHSQESLGEELRKRGVSADSFVDKNLRGNASDEIDIFDILKSLWGIRNYMLWGLVIGVTVGSLLGAVLMKPTFRSRLMVTIDRQSLPAIQDPALIKDKFKMAISNPEIASYAFDKMMQEAPAFAERLGEKKISASDLAASVASEEGGLPPIKISDIPGSANYMIELNFPVDGLGDKVGTATIFALKAIAEEANRRVVENVTATNQKIIEEARSSYDKTEQIYSKVRLEREIESSALKVKLSQIEYRLSKMAKVAGLKIDENFSNGGGTPLEKFSEGKKLSINVNGADTSNEILMRSREDAILNTDRAFRLLSMLAEDNKISPEEAQKIQSEISTIQLENLRSESLAAGIRSANQAVLSKMVNAMEELAKTVDRGSHFLPFFKFNEKFIERAQIRGDLEKKVSNRSVATLVGVALGLGFGAAAGIVKNLSKKYRGRFRSEDSLASQS